jgi:hypothetical protein
MRIAQRISLRYFSRVKPQPQVKKQTRGTLALVWFANGGKSSRRVVTVNYLGYPPSSPIRVSASAVQFLRSWKTTLTFVSASAGLPPIVAGLKRHCFTAAIAASTSRGSP